MGFVFALVVFNHPLPNDVTLHLMITICLNIWSNEIIVLLITKNNWYGNEKTGPGSNQLAPITKWACCIILGDIGVGIKKKRGGGAIFLCVILGFQRGAWVSTPGRGLNQPGRISLVNHNLCKVCVSAAEGQTGPFLKDFLVVFYY